MAYLLGQAAERHRGQPQSPGMAAVSQSYLLAGMGGCKDPQESDDRQEAIYRTAAKVTSEAPPTVQSQGDRCVAEDGGFAANVP
jgi:hypothetical protein